MSARAKKTAQNGANPANAPRCRGALDIVMCIVYLRPSNPIGGFPPVSERIESAASFLAARFPELAPLDYYRELFPVGSLERRGEYRDGAYCAIAITVRDDGLAWRTHITDGLEQLPALIDGDDFTMLAPISFAGKQATKENARWLYALEFDLDFIRQDSNGSLIGMTDLLYQTSISEQDPFNRLPRPTYIIASSNRNLHIVYLLEQPIALYKNVIQQVRRFRKAFIPKLWSSYITEAHKNPQFEISPVQAFRLCGSKSKDKSGRVRCFRTGKAISIDTLNEFVPKEAQIKDLHYKSNYTLEQAKEKFPDWYERRIVQKLPANSWQCHRGLYDWWKKRLPEVEVGHRYHYLLCMGAYSVKCGITRDELTKDVMECRRILDRLSPPNNPLTINDAMKAIQSASEISRYMKRETISQLSGLPIAARKRNGRDRNSHLVIARAALDVDYPNGEWRYKGGRPNKEEAVIQYFLEHQDDSLRDIAKALGFSYATVQKWVRKWRDEHK